MWSMPHGKAVLVGLEKKMIREAVDFMVDWITMLPECPESYGIRVFGRLTSRQQLVLLADVVSALLDEMIPPPPLNCLTEATVAAIYGFIQSQVEFELEDGGGRSDPFYWRKLVVAALDEYGQDTSCPDCPPTTVACSDAEEWNDAIWSLAETILWDADWDMDDLFLDVPPDLAAARRKKLCIAEDYYTAIPPDPTKKEAIRAVRVLKALAKDGIPEISS